MRTSRALSLHDGAVSPGRSHILTTPRHHPIAMSVWMFITRWGNSLLLLPAASFVGIGLWSDGERARAMRWAVSFGGAVLLVLATKVAFLGWGIGSRALDFSGISGHSMLASSVLPMLAWWLTQDRDRSLRRWAVLGAALFAIVVGLSRVLVLAHSTSEVVAGLAVGLVVAWYAIPRTRFAHRHGSLPWLVFFALVVFGSLSQVGDSDDAHGLVVRIALAVSGRTEPFQRASL